MNKTSNTLSPLVVFVAGVCAAATALPAEPIVEEGNWDKGVRWGLLREVTLDEASSRMEIEELDINEAGAYFMVFTPSNTTSKDAKYWAFINGDENLENYCTSYLEILPGKRITAYYDDRPYLGRAHAGSSALQTFTLLRDGTGHARWKTWSASGTHKSPVESSRGTYHRKEIENITRLTIQSDIPNALGKGSRILIYGKHKSPQPKADIREFTLTKRRTELNIEGLDAKRDRSYCLYFIPCNDGGRKETYSLFFNDDRNQNHYTTVWHGVESAEAGKAAFRHGVKAQSVLATAEPRTCTAAHAWLVHDPQGHLRWWSEQSSGKCVNTHAFGGIHRKTTSNLTGLTIRSGAKNGLSAGSRLLIYGAGNRPEPADSNGVDVRSLQYRWFKQIETQRDCTTLDIRGLDLKKAGFLNMDLIPNNLTEVFGGNPGHYWSYFNGDFDKAHYHSNQYDVQKGVLRAIGYTTYPYYGWAFAQTSSHQPALLTLDAQGHVRSRGYGTCHVQEKGSKGKAAICGRSFHYAEPLETLRRMTVKANVKNGISKGTRILIYGGWPVGDDRSE